MKSDMKDKLYQVWDPIQNDEFLYIPLQNILPESLTAEEINILRIWTAPLVNSIKFSPTIFV
jgi:hypothetical protein